MYLYYINIIIIIIIYTTHRNLQVPMVPKLSLFYSLGKIIFENENG